MPFGNVENLTLIGANLDGTGNALANTITGTAGANKLKGGGGLDVLVGAGGNDTYELENGNDVIQETTGIDTVTSTISRSLAGAAFNQVEKLTLLGSATLGTGNAKANTIIGNNLNNGLSGGVGNDILAGGIGNDILAGGIGNDILAGGRGRDTLTGGAGNDILDGGIGKDTMTGGAGADDFDFNAVADMGKTAAIRDVIKDFVHNVDDIDLRTIDANGTAAGNGVFKFLAAEGAAFTGVKGQLRWDQQNLPGRANDKTILEGDITGDKKVDFQIELSGLKILTAGDFFL